LTEHGNGGVVNVRHIAAHRSHARSDDDRHHSQDD
jgi:hypothetical protein